MLTVGIDAHDRMYVMCVLDDQGKTFKEHTVHGGPSMVAAWIKELATKTRQPARVCYEASLGYGILHDALRAVGVEVQVAHPAHLRAIWQSKKKNDRIDAHKLATMLYLDRVPRVHVPTMEVREWRVLIEHRRRLVDKRTATKNGIRALLRSHAIEAPKARRLWFGPGKTWLAGVVLPSLLAKLRLAQLLLELEHFDRVIKEAEKMLNEIGDAHPGVQLLRTMPGVGARTAEAVVAYVDDPHRFGSTSKVASYFGLVPSLDQSAGVRRLGHITRQGPATVRKLLVEAAWQGIRHSPSLRAMFERIKGGRKEQTGRALVATARHMVEVMVAMLKSGAEWREREEQPAELAKKEAISA
jgi:transposase